MKVFRPTLSKNILTGLVHVFDRRYTPKGGVVTTRFPTIGGGGGAPQVGGVPFDRQPATIVTDGRIYNTAPAVGASSNFAREDHAHGLWPWQTSASTPITVGLYGGTVVYTGAGAGVANLPQTAFSVLLHQLYVFAATGAGALTLTPNGTDTIGGAATLVLNAGDRVMIQSDGVSDWKVLVVTRTGGTNALLDGSVHSDTVATTPAAGMLIVGNTATPSKWAGIPVTDLKYDAATKQMQSVFSSGANPQFSSIPFPHAGLIIDASGLTSIVTQGGTASVYGFTVDATGTLLPGAGAFGTTGNRWSKGWFTDLESTNMPTIGGEPLLRHSRNIESLPNAAGAISSQAVTVNRTYGNCFHVDGQIDIDRIWVSYQNGDPDFAHNVYCAVYRIDQGMGAGSGTLLTAVANFTWAVASMAVATYKDVTPFTLMPGEYIVCIRADDAQLSMAALTTATAARIAAFKWPYVYIDGLTGAFPGTISAPWSPTFNTQPPYIALSDWT